MKSNKKYFKNLDKKEFNLLLDIISEWYYFNDTFDKFLENEKYASFIRKISFYKPVKIYRGLTFNTEKERTRFKEEFLLGLGSSKTTSSWTSSKRITEDFLPNGQYSGSKKFGVLLEANLKDTNEDLLFTLTGFIKDKKDKQQFFNIVLNNHIRIIKKFGKNKDFAKKIKKINLFGKMQEKIYSIVEDEFIMRDPIINSKKVKITFIE